MKKYLLYFIAALSILTKSYGQGDDITPSQAYDINKNNLANIDCASSSLLDVNKFTGIGKIKIPFYNYNVEGLDLGVSINYQTKGIQVDKIQSCYGLGWEQYAGGSIVRQRNGSMYDEFSNHVNGSGYSVFHSGFWSATPSAVYADNEPDLFIASFGGKTVKFMFSRSGELITIPKQNDRFKINRWLDGAPMTTGSITTNFDGDLSFEIIDDQGNTFFFIKKKYETFTNADCPSCTFSVQPIYKISEWMLAKVTTFEYKVIVYTYNYETDYDPGHSTINEYVSFSQNTPENWSYNTVYEQYIHNRYINYHLTKIEYPNNTDVVFNYNGTQNNIASIDVNEHTCPGGSCLKYSYKFNQLMFISRPSGWMGYTTSYYLVHPTASIGAAAYTGSLSHPGLDQTERIGLESIDIIGYDGTTTKRYYSFEYNPNPLRPRIYGGKDLWGYNTLASPVYDAHLGRDMYVPLHSYTNSAGTTSIGYDRSVCTDINVIAASSLTSLTNGSGGKISWEYMQNPLGVGGLMISTVNKFDGYSHDNDINTTYHYASGELFVSEGPGVYNYDDVHDNYGPVWLSSGFILNQAFNGTNYGFKTVHEAFTDNSGSPMSETIYHFNGITPTSTITSNIATNLLSNGVGFGSAPFANKQYLCSWGIGLLVQKDEYDKNNQMTRSTINDYDVNCVANSSANFLGTAKFRISDAGLTINIVQDNFRPYTGYTRLIKTTIRDYHSATGYRENYATYDYNYDNSLNRKITSNSLNQQIEEKYIYSNAWYGYYTGGYGWPNPGTAVNYLNSKNVSKLVGIQKYTKVSSTHTYLNSASISGLTQAMGNIVRPKYTYIFSTASLLDYSLTDINHIDMFDLSLGNGNAYLKPKTISKFDDRGYEIEITDNKGNGNNVYMSNVIDNETGDKLAEVRNAKYEEIAYCGFEMRYVYPAYTWSTAYKGNMGMSNLSGITTAHHLLGRASYHCDNAAGWSLNTNGNLSNGKSYTVSMWVLSGGTVAANDGSSASVSLTIDDSYTDPNTGEMWNLYKGTFVKAGTGGGIDIWAGGAGSCFVDEIKVYPADAMMVTSNYLPFIGKTADVDINDNIKTYEYDVFGNLKLTRDKDGNVISKIINVTQGH